MLWARCKRRFLPVTATIFSELRNWWGDKKNLEPCYRPHLSFGEQAMSEQPPSPEKAGIALMNDAFRRAGPNGNWFITQGVQALPDELGLIDAVRTFNTFTPENDTRGEHDFGSIVWHSNKTYWKIDYYDQALQYWCDPLS